jgi:DNA polymerase-1
MSSNDPNLQNVPMRSVEGKAIRRAFKAQCSPRCGCGKPHVWMKCDFDQIEQRVMAHMSRDQGMIEAFRGPDDFFVAMCRNMYDEPDFQKSDPRRTTMKNAAYADIYGAGPDKFAIMTGMVNEWGDPDVDRARQFMKDVHDLYPGPPRFAKKVMAQANARFKNEGEAYVRSPLTGRKLVADRGRFFALVNYLIQGMAGELLKMKIRDASASGLDPFMVLAVHDEIDLDVPIDQADDVIDTLNDIFNDHETLSVPITASVEVGDSWGTVKELES